MSRHTDKRDQSMFVLGRPDWCKQRSEPLEVMCLGLSRTGTSSMLEAMSILGYGTMYNTREALRRQQTSLYSQLLHQKYEGTREIRIEQLESLWGEYKAISGEAAYSFAEESIRLYPNAKVILTVRDNEEQWLRSISDTMWYNRKTFLTRYLPYVDQVWANIAQFTRPFWKFVYCNDVENHGIRVYREHNAMVQRLAEGRVLVYNTKEGWEPLCRFLEKEVPDVPFPHVLKTADHRAIFGVAKRQALGRVVRKVVVGGALPAVVVGLIWWKRSRVGELLSRLKSS